MKKSMAICREVSLPADLQVAAAQKAIEECPQNAPSGVKSPARIGVLASKWWGLDRVRDLTVGFMEQTSVAMRDKVLAYANRWGEFSRARFRWTQTSPIIRVAFNEAGAYYSYLGSDALSIPANRHTLMLGGFTMRTPDSEWTRVVIHEFGHALGCPHEQQRREILSLLDEQKTIAYFMRTQGWSELEVRQQILIPLEEFSLMNASPHADQQSIMCYQFVGAITKNGQPIPGGLDLSPIDKQYFARTYPPDAPTPPPVSPGVPAEVWLVDAAGSVISKWKPTA